MHERRLHVDAEQNAEPDEIDAEMLGGRADQRHDDEGELEEIEKEGEDEDEDVDDDEEAELTAGQAGEQLLDPQVSVDAEESEAEDARSDEDEEHEGRQLGGRIERLTQHRPVESALDRRQNQRTDGAHGTTFGGRRQADEDGAEDKEDEHQRRDQGDDDAYDKPEAVMGAKFLGQCWCRVGEDRRHADDVGEVEAGEDQPRNDRAGIHVADRTAELVGHDDQHQARRNDLRQRSGCRDDAGGEAPVVAVAQHDRQRDKPHGDDRGGDNAGGRGEQGADDDHGEREAAAHRAEQLADGVEQILRHARSFKHEPHEGEERHGKQRVVAHHGIEAVGQRLEEGR